MSITKHHTVLSALEKRALRYRRKGHKQVDLDDLLYNDAVDETGTVSTVGLTDDESDYINIATEYTEQMEIEGVCEEVLEVHGRVPGKKSEGVTRLVYENPNGFNSRIAGNEKLDKAKEIIDELEADLAAYSETRLNAKHKDNKNGFSQMFRGGESEIRSVSAHNVHENVGRTQEGGTALLCYGSLIEQYDFEQSGKDDTGLGRWVVMTFRGADGIVTRIVCGYNPCYNNKKQSRTSYQQHRRYFIMTEKDTTCPRKRFREDLIRQLKKWREDGDRLVVCMDANEDIYRKAIGKAMTDPNGLNMKEAIQAFTGKKLGATFFRGTTTIDGLWHTSDVVVVGASVMPCGYGVGDHRLFVIDFLTSSLVGNTPPSIVRAQARRLNTKIPQAADKYVVNLEKNLLHHKNIQRLGAAHESSIHKSVVKERVDAIDRETKQYMVHSEKKCRRIKSGKIQFSPESAVWIRRRQVYRSILRYHGGKIRNRGNLKRAARKCGIKNALQLSLREVRKRLQISRQKCDYYKKHGHRYRRQHLNRRLEAAKVRCDEDAETKILAIIQREKDRSYWRRLNYNMSKPTGRSVRVVQTSDEDGGVTEYDTQRSVENGIWDGIHGKRFYLAEQAPICQGRLRGDFGYNAATISARQVLDGTYEFPADCDTSTVALLKECRKIRKVIPQDSVSTRFTREHWQQRWRKAKEKTSSSQSGLHFAHYIAGAESDVISHTHSLKTEIAVRWGFGLERWGKGLSCMLEKKPGCTLIEKLRAILLMEADFNFKNGTLYGNRMLDVARKYKLMPEEIFSKKGKTADDGSLGKQLVYDIIRQSRCAAAVSSIDAANCYDSVAHAIVSLCFQAFGVPVNAVESMLTTIQNMKYFLRTAFGDSKGFRGSTICIKFQGLCQGSRAAPGGWAVISITILGAHKREGHGGHFICPVTKVREHLAAILFVDDTDLLHINMELDESANQVHAAMQDSIESWGRLLIASGGAFKPSKCFSHLISFGWKPNGQWKYDKNEENEELDFHVPMPDGSYVPIEPVGVDTAKETLGVWSCPSGDSTKACSIMEEKGQEWIDRAKEGHLARRDIWFLVDHQFWPKVGYGLCCNMAPVSKLNLCLKKQYWELIPLGGVIRSAPKELRQVSTGFYGIGCPNVAVECCVAQMNKLLMHYGCPSSIGKFMKMSLNFMVLEMGISTQPLQESYSKYGSWVTLCWLKTVWEKCQLYGVVVEFSDVEAEPPRDGDQWLMRLFIRLGYTKVELEQLNRVRIFFQVLYLSDILCAEGKFLDRKYLIRRKAEEKWSKYNFPREKPRNKDIRLWRVALS